MLTQCQDPATFAIRQRVLREYELNDEAHQIGHADNVFNLLCYINFNQLLGIPEVELALMAYVHDIFARFRKHHEILASQALPEICQELNIDLSKDTMQRITMAILEHRASFKGVYFSIYSEALSAADRGRPTSVKQLVLRSYKYARSKYNHDRQTNIDLVFKHVKEKFGRDGYARYSPIYDAVFGDALVQQIAEVEYLTRDDAAAIIIRHIGQEEHQHSAQTCWITQYTTLHKQRVSWGEDKPSKVGNGFGTVHPSQDADHDGDCQTEWTTTVKEDGGPPMDTRTRLNCSDGKFLA